MKKILLTPYYTYLTLTRSQPEFLRAYRRLTKQDYGTPMHHAVYGLTITMTSKGAADSYLVYAKSVSDLAHEFAHVILKLFQEINSDPREGGGEPFAYMMSHLMEEALKK